MAGDHHDEHDSGSHSHAHHPGSSKLDTIRKYAFRAGGPPKGLDQISEHTIVSSLDLGSKNFYASVRDLAGAAVEKRIAAGEVKSQAWPAV